RPVWGVYERERASFFRALLPQKKGGEIGGGRATRQPGQVRKEAALTRSGSGRSSVSYLFFERIAPKGCFLQRLRSRPKFRKAGFEKKSVADRSMTDAGNPPNDQAGFNLGGGVPAAGAPYRVLARKYRPASFDDL